MFFISVCLQRQKTIRKLTETPVVNMQLWKRMIPFLSWQQSSVFVSSVFFVSTCCWLPTNVDNFAPMAFHHFMRCDCFKRQFKFSLYSSINRTSSSKFLNELRIPTFKAFIFQVSSGIFSEMHHQDQHQNHTNDKDCDRHANYCV